MNFLKGDRGWKSKIGLVEALFNLVVSVCVSFEECAAKTVGGVGFLTKAYFSLPQCCQFLAHGCHNWDIDLKFKMGGPIDTILMWLKFCDDPISSLDFCFIGGCTLNKKFSISIVTDIFELVGNVLWS